MAINGKPRTDMASEAHRLAQNGRRDLGPLPGVKTEESRDENGTTLRVEILDERGAEALHKPVGRYCTLETESLPPPGDARFPTLARRLSEEMRRLLGAQKGPFLVACLGNHAITPDALGPLSARRILATRHMKRAGYPLFASLAEVAVCTPGVLGSTGLESALQIRALADAIRPAQLLVIDALAGAEPTRLCRSVQITDSGIAPGSGVGNDRPPLDAESFGLPVLALGVPTVIDASCLGDGGLRGMFVTPRDIDEQIRRASQLLAYAVNFALHPGLSQKDLSALLE